MIRDYVIKDPEKRKEYYQKNRKKILKYSRIYRQNHKDEIKKRWRKWYKKNYKRYSQKHRDKNLKRLAKYRDENRETLREKNKLYQKNNTRKVRESRRRRYLNGGKETMRKKKLQKRYGITFEQYEQMFQNQNGLCAVCGKPEARKFNGVITFLTIDHCHKTKKVRELLCHKCNITIGMADENIEILASAIKYLTKHSE